MDLERHSVHLVVQVFTLSTHLLAAHVYLDHIVWEVLLPVKLVLRANSRLILPLLVSRALREHLVLRWQLHVHHAPTALLLVVLALEHVCRGLCVATLPAFTWSKHPLSRQIAFAWHMICRLRFRRLVLV